MSRLKILRMKRVLKFETQKQKQMEWGLAEANRQLEREMERLNNVRDRLDRCLENHGAQPDLISRATNLVLWTDRLDELLVEQESRVEEARQVRDQKMKQVKQARSRVKGLELLVEKLLSEEKQESDRQASIEATDHFLRKRDTQS